MQRHYMPKNWGGQVGIDYKGENCRIHINVHIATSTHNESLVPHIGNNVFIGPGAVIVGDIKIADNIAIGVNSFVNKSFLEEGIIIAGVPARKVSDKGFDSCYRRSTEILRIQIANKSSKVRWRQPCSLRR